MTADKPCVLVIEDDNRIRRLLKLTFEQKSFRHHEATNAELGISLAASLMPDIVILDLGLPDRDGLEVIEELRSWSKTPIIVLSARGQESDKVRALDLGADDYLTKPFGVEELMARVRVALRHAAPAGAGAESAVFRERDLLIDREKRLVFVGDKEIHLTPLEYRLLGALAKHAGKVITHNQLLREVWGPHAEHELQYLRVYMNQLRTKLEPVPARPQYLLTEIGVGYRLKTVE